MSAETCEILYNDQSRVIPAGEIAGFQLRALFGIDPDLQLVIEGDVDRWIPDEEVIRLPAGKIRLFVRPPTMMGASVA